MSNVTVKDSSTLETKNEVKPVKETWIPFSPTIEEYQKLYAKIDLEGKLEIPVMDAFELKRDRLTRVVKGVYTRKVSAIYVTRTDDDNLWLNWNETREGKSPMKQKKVFEVNNMGKKKIPIPKETQVFDQENEEYSTVITGEKENTEEYFIAFTAGNLNELLEDANPYKTLYYVSHEGQRTYSSSKQELLQLLSSKDIGKEFAKLYDSKLNRSQQLVSK